jgi:hypothetical protein
MADDNSKGQLIDAFRLMPEGIQDFLDTPIPEPPTISTPGDVDSAIIASGIASKYICDLFGPFAGFTPIEMLARIGQHNSVLEIAMLAGLEYVRGGSQPISGDFSLEILEPADGATYLPGELRIHAKGVNGDLAHCAAELPDRAPVSMDDIGDGVFEGYLSLEDEQAYSITVTGVSADDQQVSASANFTISSDPEEGPEPPGGTDGTAIDVAEGILSAALRRFLAAKSIPAYAKALWGYAKATFYMLVAILRRIAKGKILEALNVAINEAIAVITLMDQALDNDDSDAIDREIGRFQSKILEMLNIIRFKTV